MKKIKTFFGYILLVVAISSCCRPIDKGKIISKRYEPFRTYYYTSTVMVGKVPIMTTQLGTDDEDWIITVKGIVEKDTIIQEFYITQSYYNSISIGDNFYRSAAINNIIQK
jgi:hypothetical protein